MTPHLTMEELVRWRDHGSAADRDRTVAHLAACDSCGTAYSEILDTAPVEAPTTGPETGAFVARGLALGPGGGRRWALRAPALALAASVAAIALSAALIPGVRRAIVPGAPADSADSLRATRLLLVSPVGDVRPPLEFTWRCPVDAAVYRIELRDAQRRPLGTVTTAEERLPLPDELRAMLQPNVRYEWTVIAVDERGEPLLTSQPETFRIVAEPSP